MIEISYLTENDLEEAALIESQNFTRPWSKEAIRSSLNQNETVYLVAKIDGKVVGYCGFLQVLDEGEITNVSVSLSYQNQGIGFKMMKHLLKISYERGVSTLVLEVRESNKNAQHLYEKLGFIIIGKRKNFYEYPREDATIMIKES
jgi:ribosomal-protein-alanine N-acetyltransferase